MPSHKSAEKRMRQSIKRRDRNQHWRSRVRNRIKLIRDALAQGDVETATREFPATVSIIGKAQNKGVMPKNRAARTVSRLNNAIKRASA